jgi:hypothetical protein
VAINFSLSDKRIEDPTQSWQGRPWHGWVSEADPQEIWKNNRGIWRFGDRVENERIATFSRLGEIVLVAAITGIEDVSPEFQANGVRRRALQGQVLPKGHPVHDALIGRSLPRHRVELTYHDTSEQDAMLAGEIGRAATAEHALPGATEQGRVMDPQRRKALEDAAQHRLETYYRDRGWAVEDVRFGGPYDAIARKNDQIRYLEAKGTQSNGTTVTVTAGEVAHARQHPGECVIGILSGLRFTDHGELDDSDANFALRQWCPADEDLQAIEYRWNAAPTATFKTE